eukprot:TRINITY_DN50882_c0_g1_i1.p1 TRINITY_DN50882_c0_g1~~TRINITY_DN50882_c0_g1_i1.p1  ORF type:complete len:383 (-),score=44.64 TRINITY_DN50882_c0_g1_i1:93-1166(-)
MVVVEPVLLEVSDNEPRNLVRPTNPGGRRVKRSQLSKDRIWDSAETAWTKMVELSEGHTFFEHIEISVDGGISEIGVKEDLWSVSRYFSALLLIFFVVYNVIFLLQTDIRTLMQNTDEGHTDYLLSKSFLGFIGFTDVAHKPSKIIAAIELLFLALLLCKLFANGVCIAARDGHHRWLAVAHFFWEDLVDLSSFSAIKLLAFVTPQQASYDLNHILWYDWSYFKFARFLISRPIMLCLGLDCFLIKVRGALTYIVGPSDLELSSLLGAIILLNQILGVVQITKTIKGRLYRFVFGGEDGIMTQREKVRQDVWEAMVSRKIFDMYSLPRAFAFMMSWCDDDFQMLALSEKSREAVEMV